MNVPRKVLIVDDAPAIRESLLMVLKALGVPEDVILLAGDAAEAMRLFHRDEPDLVFMDILMPRGNGDRAALQMLAVKPSIKVVVVTGLDRGDARVRSLVSAGAYEVLEKPVRFEKIRDVLHLINAEASGLHRVH